MEEWIDRYGCLCLAFFYLVLFVIGYYNPFWLLIGAGKTVNSQTQE